MEQTTKLDELEHGGYIVIPIKGVSMRPLLYENSSHVLIRKIGSELKKNDVVLYVRRDGTQVLHRIIDFDGDICLIRGDNTFALERVPLDTVKGVMERLWRGKKEIAVEDKAYKLYVAFWNVIYPLRLFKHKAVGKVKRIVLKACGRKF